MVAVRLWCVDESDGVVPSREWMEAAQKAYEIKHQRHLRRHSPVCTFISIAGNGQLTLERTNGRNNSEKMSYRVLIYRNR